MEDRRREQRLHAELRVKISGVDARCVNFSEYAIATNISGNGALLSHVSAELRCGDLLIVEIKSSVADFRSDRKWASYRDFADRLYFAVPNHFPQGLIPEECGLMVTDPFGAAVLRDGCTTPLNPNRRRALTLRFARIGAARLRRFLDREACCVEGI